MVAVDGPSGVGKSSASRGLAERLGFRHVDTGAMYRAVAHVGASLGLDPADARRLGELARDLRVRFRRGRDGTVRVLADGEDVTSAIRRPEIGQLASTVSAHPEVREHLVRAQRAMARGRDLVMEGRDIGTVVFPDAPVKFFVTADATARARRRRGELAAGGLDPASVDVEAEQAVRDARDSTRVHAPLRQAPDAVVLETTHMTLEEVVEAMHRVVSARRPG